MNNSKLAKLVNAWKRLNDSQTDEIPMDTLSAFVKDTEHEMVSVFTALQAHIDLLHDEQKLNNMPVNRFEIIDRAVTRLIADTGILASVSAQARTPPVTQKLMVEKLVNEIIEETRSAFQTSKVSISSSIASGTAIICNANSLKVMIKGIVLAVLNKCTDNETIRIVGITQKKRVSLSFVIGTGKEDDGEFKRWELGELRLIPTNGEGITLAGVDAIARLNNGNLSMRTSTNHRQAYKLIFNV